MNGARRLAHDAIVPLIHPGHRVLDVCCGDCWMRRHTLDRGASWVGVDQRDPSPKPPEFRRVDVSKDTMVWGFAPLLAPLSFDLAISAWGVQHLLGWEALAWLAVRRHLKPDGRFVCIGRFLGSAGRENGRADPLNGHSQESLRGLALATGFTIETFCEYRYEGDEYAAGVAPANAFAAVMRIEPCN